MHNTSRPKTATDFRQIPDFSTQIHPPQSRFQQRSWGSEFSIPNHLIVCWQGQNLRQGPASIMAWVPPQLAPWHPY